MCCLKITSNKFVSIIIFAKHIWKVYNFSAVQYSLSKEDDTLKLPEKYNGLGYQNLISMVFDLMGFRDAWIKKGKAASSDMAIEPLHLVLVEEPEAHLHVQVQQVFIRKAYEILTRGTVCNHKRRKTKFFY